jgi:hypothetical protein
MVSEAREGRPGPSMIDPPGDAELSHLTIYLFRHPERSRPTGGAGDAEDDPNLSKSQVYIEKNLNQ